jgi:hypothetical protein
VTADQLMLIELDADPVTARPVGAGGTALHTGADALRISIPLITG